MKLERKYHSKPNSSKINPATRVWKEVLKTQALCPSPLPVHPPLLLLFFFFSLVLELRETLRGQKSCK